MFSSLIAFLMDITTGGIVLEEALDLSSDRILNEWGKKHGVPQRSIQNFLYFFIDIRDF